MNEQRDLGIALAGATLLMLSLVCLAQCSARAHAPAPGSPTSAGVQPARAADTQRQGRRGAAEKEDNEESGRVKNIGHALQTIGADPELRKTYGFE